MEKAKLFAVIEILAAAVLIVLIMGVFLPKTCPLQAGFKKNIEIKSFGESGVFTWLNETNVLLKTRSDTFAYTDVEKQQLVTLDNKTTACKAALDDNAQEVLSRMPGLTSYDLFGGGNRTYLEQQAEKNYCLSCLSFNSAFFNTATNNTFIELLNSTRLENWDFVLFEYFGCLVNENNTVLTIYAKASVSCPSCYV